MEEGFWGGTSLYWKGETWLVCNVCHSHREGGEWHWCLRGWWVQSSLVWWGAIPSIPFSRIATVWQKWKAGWVLASFICCLHCYRHCPPLLSTCGVDHSPLHPPWKVKVTQLCRTPCDPMDYTVHGILQARILEWVAIPFSRGSSQPRDRTPVPHIAGGFFTSWATREDPPTLVYPYVGTNGGTKADRALLSSICYRPQMTGCSPCIFQRLGIRRESPELKFVDLKIYAHCKSWEFCFKFHLFYLFRLPWVFIVTYRLSCP